MVFLVDTMLKAKKQLAAARTYQDTYYYENKCASFDNQIDSLVYDLYGLTSEEIVIVEGASSRVEGPECKKKKAGAPDLWG
jgi:hypothetical protein